jgi:hypothetical protein
LHNAVQANLFEQKSAIVLDRCHLSEVIYGPLKRGIDRLGYRYRILERLREEYGIRQVVCLPPWDVALDNWKAKTDEYLKTEDEFNRVYDAYQIYAESSGFETYDYVNAGPFVCA